MSESPKPCPFCGEVTTRVETEDERTFVVCTYCWSRGPSIDGTAQYATAEAVRRWSER